MGEESDEKKPKDKQLHVKVKAPRDPEPKEFVWDEHLLVGEAAQEAATAFGYSGGVASLVHHNEALASDLELHAAGVHNGERLDLLDTGGGV
jgi:hypothetical protein